MTVTQVCTKIAYLTKREARRALHTAQAARDSGVRTRRECRYYHCPCGSWHLTSRPAQEDR